MSICSSRLEWNASNTEFSFLFFSSSCVPFSCASFFFPASLPLFQPFVNHQPLLFNPVAGRKILRGNDETFNDGVTRTTHLNTPAHGGSTIYFAPAGSTEGSHGLRAGDFTGISRHVGSCCILIAWTCGFSLCGKDSTLFGRGNIIRE